MTAVDRRSPDQPMGATWTLSRATKPGDDDQLHVVDQRGGANGRVVCAIVRRLAWRPSNDDFVRLLDEQDLENGRAIAALPTMRRQLADLVAWAAENGFSDEPCWDAARLLLTQLQDHPKPE